MPLPKNVRLKVSHCLDAYLRRNRENFPKYALVTVASSALFSVEMTCSDVKDPSKKYLSHDRDVSNRIEILISDRFGGGLEYAFALSKDRKVNGRDVLVDLAWDRKKIEEYLR
jgi:hypothetical protein